MLDTCAFLWVVSDQTKLSSRALSILADTGNSFSISAITVNEVHRLIRKGKISVNAPSGLQDWFRKALIQHSIRCEPIGFEIAHAAEVLPAIHNDPADRFILATAQIMNGRVLSPDTTMPKYPNITVEW